MLFSCLAPVALPVAVNHKPALPLQSLSEVTGTHAVDLHLQDGWQSYPWSPSLPSGWFLMRSYRCDYVLIKYPSLLGNWKTMKSTKKKIFKVTKNSLMCGTAKVISALEKVSVLITLWQKSYIFTWANRNFIFIWPYSHCSLPSLQGPLWVMLLRSV